MMQQPGGTAPPALQQQRQPAQAQSPQFWQQQQQQQPYGAAPPNAAPFPGGSDEVRTLWIGDLPYWMNEAYLTSYFHNIGDLVSAKIIHNKHTSVSKRYGFLEFRSRAAAELVLQFYDGGLMPFSFRMNWALGRRDKPTDNSPEHPIFVGDLAGDVTDYILHEKFKEVYQSVKGAKVVTDRVTGRSKGYGFVTFGDEKEQQRAMTEMNGVVCSTRQMRVGPAANKKPRFVAPTPTKSAFAEELGEKAPRVPSIFQPQPHPFSQVLQFWQQQQPFGSAPANAFSFPGRTNEVRTLWIGGLQYWMDEAYLIRYFHNIGERVSAKVIRNKQSNISVGYGFLEFGSRSAAQSVLENINGLIMPDSNPQQSFQLNWARDKRTDNTEHTVFVGDLAGDVTGVVLLETFKNMYQSVKGAKVVTDRVTGRCKGYGFVTFGDEMEQQWAITEMNGVLCSTRQMRVGPAANTKPMSAAPSQSGGMAPLALGKDQQQTPQKQQYPPRECLVLPPQDLPAKTEAPVDGFEYRWIRNLQPWMDERYLTNCFNKFEIVSAKVINKQTLLSVGYGLLEFSSSRAASAATSFPYCLEPTLLAAAYELLPLCVVEGHHDFNNTTTTIFVGDLDPSVSEEILKQVFSQCGELVHVKIPVGKRRRMLVDQIVCKSCGFVQFVDRTSAEQALSTLNGTMLGGQNLRLSWALDPLIQQMDQGQPSLQTTACST